MASEEVIQKKLVGLEEDMQKALEKVEVYQRTLMKPIWEKRREIVKDISGFWNDVFSNSPYSDIASDNDIVALENLADFHVEYDENNPNYRKVVATFKKNDVFKNEALTKEFILEDDDVLDAEGQGGKVSTKTVVEYHEGKAPSKGDEEDEPSFLEWFASNDVGFGQIITDDVFPNALDYFQGDDDEDDVEEIELGSDDEDDLEDEEEEEQVPKKRKY